MSLSILILQPQNWGCHYPGPQVTMRIKVHSIVLPIQSALHVSFLLLFVVDNSIVPDSGDIGSLLHKPAKEATMV